MTEQTATTPGPEDILKLKDGISEQWNHLPPEHQATLVLVLLGQVVAGEQGTWTLSSIELLWKTHAQADARLLPIPALSRADLERANLTLEEIAQLTDDDLRMITHQIERHFTNDVFWEELEFVARDVIQQKQQT